MVEIARRILKYKALRGERLHSPALELEVELLEDINKIALRYVTEAQNHWRQDTRELTQ